MAHKHNRRRVRHRSRSRNSNILSPTFDISDDFSVASESCDFLSASSSSVSSSPPALPATLRKINTNVASRHWYNRYTAWQNRDRAQKLEASKIEAEQIKLFGGEPGDDVGLCYKMMEVFEGMEWVDALE